MKTAISLPDDLFESADLLVERLGVSRGGPCAGPARAGRCSRCRRDLDRARAFRSASPDDPRTRRRSRVPLHNVPSLTEHQAISRRAELCAVPRA
jgi:hypothetical protein